MVHSGSYGKYLIREYLSPTFYMKTENEFLKIKNRRELASYLGFPYKKFCYILFVLNDSDRYTTFDILKRSGGKREISSPKMGIRKMQMQLKSTLEEIYRPRGCVHGYVQNRGIKTNAIKHVRKKYISKIDLKDFYPSIHFGRVYGMFRSAPFLFDKKVASCLAHICTYKKKLPAGAPTSPVISNFLCSRMDKELIAFSKENKLFYTRFADDMTFSTNFKKSKYTIVKKNNYIDKILLKINKGQNFVCSRKIRQIINKNGFKVNHKKTKLIGSDSRQMVTGLVVNKKINVNKDYVSQLKGIIHAWEKYGIDSTAERYFKKYNKRNYHKETGKPILFEKVVIGKLLHLRDIKGTNNNTYKKLSKKLGELSPSFRLYKKDIFHSSDLKIKLLVEGKTDLQHLEAAFKYFQSKNEFNLQFIDFDGSTSHGSDSKLMAILNKLKGVKQSTLTIGIFDNDTNFKTLLGDSGSKSKEIQKWSDGLYSMSLPVPSFRDNMNFEDVCIEFLYQDEDLHREDQNGRRLFKKNEFLDNGKSAKDSTINYSHIKHKRKIVDQGVTQLKEGEVKSIALSKSDFAVNILNEVEEFKDINFEGFRPLFERIEKIQDLFLGIN